MGRKECESLWEVENVANWRIYRALWEGWWVVHACAMANGTRDPVVSDLVSTSTLCCNVDTVVAKLVTSFFSSVVSLFLSEGWSPPLLFTSRCEWDWAREASWDRALSIFTVKLLSSCSSYNRTRAFRRAFVGGTMPFTRSSSFSLLMGSSGSYRAAFLPFAVHFGAMCPDGVTEKRIEIDSWHSSLPLHCWLQINYIILPNSTTH